MPELKATMLMTGGPEAPVYTTTSSGPAEPDPNIIEFTDQQSAAAKERVANERLERLAILARLIH